MCYSTTTATREQHHPGCKAPIVPRWVMGQGHAVAMLLPMCCGTSAIAAHVQHKSCGPTLTAPRLQGPHTPWIGNGRGHGARR